MKKLSELLLYFIRVDNITFNLKAIILKSKSQSGSHSLSINKHTKIKKLSVDEKVTLILESGLMII